MSSISTRRGERHEHLGSQIPLDSKRNSTFCWGRSHQKPDCPKAWARKQNSEVNSGVVWVVVSLSLPQQVQSQRKPEFSTFVSDGKVSLVDGKQVVVKNLRDMETRPCHFQKRTQLWVAVRLLWLLLYQPVLVSQHIDKNVCCGQSLQVFFVCLFWLFFEEPW